MAFTKTKQYIDTDDGTAGTLLIPKLIIGPLVEEQDKNLIPRDLAAEFFGPSQIQGSTFTRNLKAENTMDVREIGEGGEVYLDNVDFETVTYTPRKYGVSIRITREMMEDSQFNLLQENLKTAGKRFAENETNLILGALDGANTTVGGAAAITIANITTAMLNLEGQDYDATDYLIGPEVLRDLRNIDTFVEANKAGDTDILRTGFKGNILGMRVQLFSPNAGSNAVTTSSYVLDRSKAYGIAIKRDITVENFNLPTFDMQGAAITTRIDVQLIRSKAVSKITTS